MPTRRRRCEDEAQPPFAQLDALDKAERILRRLRGEAAGGGEAAAAPAAEAEGGGVEGILLEEARGEAAPAAPRWPGGPGAVPLSGARSCPPSRSTR